MSQAVYDFVSGVSPQISAEVCRQHRIGFDRVWHVAVVMLTYSREDGDHEMFMSRKFLAKRTGINERDIRTCLEVMEQSGIITRAGRMVHPEGTPWPSVHWRPTWQPSGPMFKVDYTDIKVDPEACSKAGVGRDRAWRIAYLLKAMKYASIEALAAAIGTGERQVRKALAAIGKRVAKRLSRAWEWACRPDPRHNAPTTTQVTNTPSQTSSGREPTRLRARGRARLKWMFGGKLMPWEIFANDYVPDDSEVPTSQLSRRMQERIGGSMKGVPRSERPVETWSPLDSAREFRERFQAAYPAAPGDTGDLLKLSKILGKMRKQYGHDARTEMFVLDAWLSDPADVVYRNPHVPAWRKWLSAFTGHYRDAERRVATVDPEYTTVEGRFQRDVAAPQLADALAAAKSRAGSFAALARQEQAKAG